MPQLGILFRVGARSTTLVIQVAEGLARLAPVLLASVIRLRIAIYCSTGLFLVASMLGLSLIHWLVVLSVPVSMVGTVAYMRDTLAGRTQPNRVSWAMWALSPLLSTAAALTAGADGWATVRTLMAGLMPLLILGASFVNRRSYWRLSVFDILCGGCALLALIVWRAISAPQLAILCAIAGDFCASLPTLRKAWRYPETETGAMFGASFFSVVLGLPSIPIWNIANAGFQLYLLMMSAVLLVAVYRKRIAAWGHQYHGGS